MKLQFSRRYFIACMLGLACLPLFSGCAPKPLPISLATHIWPGYEPISLAREMGWLDEKLVRLVQTTSATESIKLLEEGKIDAAGLTLDEVLRIREKGIPISVILVCDISAGADMLIARPDIKTLSELKGRRVAVEEGALGALMLFHVLQAAELKREDIKPISITVDQQGDAWKRGEIDAAVTYEPGSSDLLKSGGKILFDSRQIPNLIFDVIAVRTSVLDVAHDSALQHLVSSHLKGLQYINTNPDDAAYRMSIRLNLPHDEVMGAFKGLILPDLDNNLRLIDTATPTVLESAAQVADVMQKAGILKKQAGLTGLLRPKYLHQPN